MRQSLRMGLAAVSWIGVAEAGLADDSLESRLQDLARSELASWVSDPELITEIRERNRAHASLSQEEIDALDRQWRAEAGMDSAPFISEVLGRHWSIMLRQLQDLTNGLVVEVFIMDNRGLNVAQNAITSDYWQGDEPKFQQSYGRGPDAVYVESVGYDESAQMDLAPVSISITDPVTGEVIGAATFGIDPKQLR